MSLLTDCNSRFDKSAKQMKNNSEKMSRRCGYTSLNAAASSNATIVLLQRVTFKRLSALPLHDPVADWSYCVGTPSSIKVAIKMADG